MDKSELSRHFQERREVISLDQYIRLLSPSSIQTMRQLEEWGSRTNRQIKELQAAIETLQSYDQLLYARAQELTVAPWHHEIHLTREKRYYENKVYYYLRLLKVYDTAGIDPETLENHKYTGTERRQAIKDFESYQKSHPGIVAVKDIEKSKWER